MKLLRTNGVFLHKGNLKVKSDKSLQFEEDQTGLG